MKLALFLAQMCHYAQEYVGDPDAWDHSDLDYLMQCTSYQVACFLSQNTRDGSSGVDWSVVHKDLCEMPVKSIEEWQKIINNSVEFLGGWQTPIKGIRVVQSMSSMDEDGADVLADASLEATQEKPHLPAHQKYYGYTGHLWQDKPVWARRMELLRAECNESCEPFNQRIEVMHQMCIDLAIQAEIDFDAQATGCTLKQLIDHYGHAAGTAIFSMIYNEDD